MYRSRRSQGGNKGHLILDHKNNVATLNKEIKIKINNMKYKIKVIGIVKKDAGLWLAKLFWDPPRDV